MSGTHAPSQRSEALASIEETRAAALRVTRTVRASRPLSLAHTSPLRRVVGQVVRSAQHTLPARAAVAGERAPTEAA